MVNFNPSLHEDAPRSEYKVIKIKDMRVLAGLNYIGKNVSLSIYGIISNENNSNRNYKVKTPRGIDTYYVRDPTPEEESSIFRSLKRRKLDDLVVRAN
jgi:hypothetical protein